MKFNTSYCIILLCIVLCVNQVLSQSGKQILDEVVFPLGNVILPVLAIPPPAGPLLFAGLGLMQVCSNILSMGKKTNTAVEEKKGEKQLSKVDLMEVQLAIKEHVKTLDNHLLQESQKIIRDLTLAIEENGKFEDMRQTVYVLQKTFIDKMKSIIDTKITGIQKRLTIEDMLNYSSDFRSKLSLFINKFIKSNDNEFLLLKRNNLFFEHVLEKENFLAAKDEDCNSDSFHSKIYKSFMYILKVLTESYVMAVSAHVVEYQAELQNGSLSEADEVRQNAISLIDEYKNDARILIDKTRWALGNASREIRNCGNFKLEEGKTFERVSFNYILPAIWFLQYVDVFRNKCILEEKYVNITDYETEKCDDYKNDMPHGSKSTFGLNLLKPYSNKSPYSYLKVKQLNGSEAIYGRYIINTLPFEYSFLNHQDCHTFFCSAFKKKSYAISTQRVSADPGNVITGLRFRMKKKVIYIDIQQGKYIDLLSVDPKTVFWTETPESNQIAYLGPKLRKFELGDFVLKNNSVLTSIQLRHTFFRNGLIRISIDGLTPPYMNNTNSVSYENYDLELYELKLINADDPAMVDDTSKRFISKAPVAGKRYFIEFQPSDFKKDLGQSTVPIFDCREVVSNPPAPLNGLGFYHETSVGSGGLIAIKLITPYLTDHLGTLN